MGEYCSQRFPGPLVLGLTLARHFGLIMPKGGCLEMAGRPLTASAREADDRTMLSPQALGSVTFLFHSEARLPEQAGADSCHS